jgi:putative membrane protein
MSLMKLFAKNYSLRHLVGSSFIVAATALAAVNLQAKDDKDKDKPYSDTTFIQEAAQGNMAEVKMGQLASEKGQNSEVKQFGQRLVTDHGQALSELKQVAQKQGVTLPSSLDEKYQKHIDMLQAQSGAEFDKSFAKHMVKGHSKGIRKCEMASQRSQDDDIKAYAQKTLPVLREHLQIAKQTAQSVGVDSADLAAAESEDDDAEATGTAGKTGTTGTGTSSSSSTDSGKSSSSGQKDKDSKPDSSKRGSQTSP